MKPNVTVNRKGFMHVSLVGEVKPNKAALHDLAQLLREKKGVKRAYVRHGAIQGRVSTAVRNIRRVIYKTADYFCHTRFDNEDQTPTKKGHYGPPPILTKRSPALTVPLRT